MNDQASSAARTTGTPVEVLIPSWNRRERLRRALESLRAQRTPAAVCVVDNGSGDGSAEMVRHEFPEVRLLALDANTGFGAAVNRAARSSDAELIVLINNDAVADPGFIAELVETREESGAAMVAGCMVSGTGIVESAGVVADQSLHAYDHLHGVPYDRLADSLPPAPLGPSGGAALYERAAFLAAGGFDEAIFAYLEDLDLALRLRLRGARCAPAPRAFVVHEHSATLGSGSAAKNRLLTRNRRYLLWKYGRNLSLGQRARGMALDLVVVAGRAAIDRNLGAVRGWREARRSYPRRTRPAPSPGFEKLPLLKLRTAESLRRRLDRRRVTSRSLSSSTPRPAATSDRNGWFSGRRRTDS